MDRRLAAHLARGGRVLDLYSYSGGFGLAAAVAGASQVLAVDRSQAGLDLAVASAGRNGLASLTVERQDAFALDRLALDKQRFDLVIADPPAFVKSKRDLKPGLRDYRKLAHACGALVADAGFLAIACCSHHVAPDAFADEVHRGLRARTIRSIRPWGRGYRFQVVLCILYKKPTDRLFQFDERTFMLLSRDPRDMVAILVFGR